MVVFGTGSLLYDLITWNYLLLCFIEYNIFCPYMDHYKSFTFLCFPMLVVLVRDSLNTSDHQSGDYFRML